MGKIRSNENSAVRNAKLLAKIYYYMGKEMIERLGEKEGEEAIRTAVTAFGNDRVASMKEEAEERGIKEFNSIQDYFSVRDMPSDGWINSEDLTKAKYCPFHDIWKEYGDMGDKIGKLYCEVDFILFGAFGINLERNHCLTDGDEFCDFILK